jgi:hypothetical protein
MRFADSSVGRLLLTILSAWLFCIQAHATCIVLLASPDLIVLGADGKGVVGNSLYRLQEPLTMTIEKVLLVQNRIAVAQCGVEGLKNDTDGMYYSFPSFIKELEEGEPDGITVTGFVNLVKDKLPGMFGPFKHSLAMGRVHRENLPDSSETLFRMVVAGFEAGHPIAYLVTLPIDWNRLQVDPPVATKQYPDTTKHISAHVCGGDHGISDLWQGIRNPLIDEQAQKHPAEYHALTEDKVMSPEEMLTLDKSMIDVDVKESPAGVGYPLTIFTISAKSTKRYDYDRP